MGFQHVIRNILEAHGLHLQVAQQCGILIDPIYNLSAWTTALHLTSQINGEALV